MPAYDKLAFFVLYQLYNDFTVKENDDLFLFISLKNQS